jgi:eukaryotic-like serine/threonine-protein kinase
MTPEDALPFERLGEYDVLAPISEGGMASVWLGRSSTHPEQLVALKVIRPEHGRNKEFVAMFVDESRIASRLKHPNIVSIADVGYDGRRHFLAMEVLRGHTLLALSKAAHTQGKRLPYDVLAWIGARIADALHHAHELVDDTGTLEHVVHRDVNPANIFITKGGVPKLIDFGLAKARDRIASTAFGIVKGKLAYLAPEQAHGHPADRRSDVFALGVTLWETTLDRRLFLDDTDVETIRRVRETEVPDPTTLDERYPRALADALDRALMRDPKDRWQTAAGLRDALDAFVASAGHVVDAGSVRALLAEIFGNEPALAWERLVDEANADREKTRVWEGQLPAPAPTAPEPRAPARSAPTPSAPSVRLLAVAAGCSLAGALLVGLAIHGCRGGDRVGEIEQRLARVEDLLGIGDAGSPVPGPSSATVANADASVSADDRSAPCAMARVASYQAWQDALVRGKASASNAEATCASIRNDRRKQGCYYAAMSSIRAIQAARDTVIAGGAAAREAVKNVKEDPKNESIPRARAATETAFAACADDGGP